MEYFHHEPPSFHHDNYPNTWKTAPFLWKKKCYGHKKKFGTKCYRGVANRLHYKWKCLSTIKLFNTKCSWARSFASGGSSLPLPCATACLDAPMCTANPSIKLNRERPKICALDKSFGDQNVTRSRQTNWALHMPTELAWRDYSNQSEPVGRGHCVPARCAASAPLGRMPCAARLATCPTGSWNGLERSRCSASSSGIVAKFFTK